MSRTSNLFETIASDGSDRDFIPRVTTEFRPTKAPAGSREKIKVLRWRLERGFPLFHELDGNFSGKGYQRIGNCAVLKKISNSDSFS